MGNMLNLVQEKLGRSLTVPEKHQLKIAYKTLKMSTAAVGVMGGPSKEEAREIIKRLTGKVVKESNGIGYLAMWNGKTLEIRNASSLYDAKKKAIAHFRPPKSKEHMVLVHPAEKNGKPIKHIATEHHGEQWPEEVLNMPLSQFLDKLKEVNPKLYDVVEKQIEKCCAGQENVNEADIPKKKCKYCGKLRPSYLIKGHEKSCDKNPKKEDIEEASTSDGAGPYMTPNAFQGKGAFNGGRKEDEDKMKSNATQGGYKLVEGKIQITEGQYPTYTQLKKDETLNPKQKIGVSVGMLNRHLNEIARFVEMLGKLKQEQNVVSSDYWKRTHSNLAKITERMTRVMTKVRNLQS